MKPLFARRAAAMVVLFAGGHAASGAVIIDDRSFFSGIEHTFVDFETDGDGEPIQLGFLAIRQQRIDEYKDLGFVYDERPVVWGDTPQASFGGGLAPEGTLGDAHAAMGSKRVAIGGGFDGLAIHFTQPVHAFGIGVAQGRFQFDIPAEENSVGIRAFNAAGDEIGVVRLWGNLIDGQFGTVWTEVDGVVYREYLHGFMGLATTEPIARLEFELSNIAIYDDLFFSAIPAPGAGAALGLLTLGALARRRRSSGG